jgi:hypothetical protein
VWWLVDIAGNTTTPSVCGNKTVYCPAGSLAPSLVSVGYKSVSTIGNDTISESQAPCSTGHYCVDGREIACPDGRFRSVTGASTVSDCTFCPPGFFCGELL